MKSLFFANSLRIHYKVIFCVANILCIHDHFRKFTMNSLFVSSRNSKKKLWKNNFGSIWRFFDKLDPKFTSEDFFDHIWLFGWTTDLVYSSKLYILKTFSYNDLPWLGHGTDFLRFLHRDRAKKYGPFFNFCF